MILDAQWLQRVRVVVLCLLLLFIQPANAQTVLFFPVIFKDGSMALKSTIRFVKPYGNQNYVLNSSGEIAGNFSNQGGGTVTRVTDYQKYGLYSYEVAPAGAGDGGNFTLLALASRPNYASFRVLKPGAMKLNITIGSATKEARLLGTIDTEWSLYYAAFSAAESSGQTNLRITQKGSISDNFFLDGLQVEPDKLTSYIDGTQEGCAWLGAPHASASIRSGDSRAGGVVQNFWEGYHFFPEKILGGGAAVEELNIDSYAFLPGGELNSSKIQPREFSLIGFFLGNSVEELHEKAQALELELGLNTYPGSQPVRLRYSGARVQKEIAARYAGGLEGDLPIYHNDDWSVEDEKWVRNYKFKMRASIQFIATDPFWYEVGESATLLDTNDNADFSYIAGRLISTGQWSALGEPSAAGGVLINAIAEAPAYIYIGGSFVNFDGIAAADRIARYNKQTGVWSAMGSGLNGTVTDMAVGPDGNLYIIGQFTDAGGHADADYFTMWDGSDYNALGTPASGITFTTATVLKFDLLGQAFIGGSFLNWAGIANADRIVMWDGASYNAVGTGANDGNVNAIDVYSNNDLLIGGAFTSFNGTAANFIVRWDGTTATPLGAGMDALVNEVIVTPGDVAYIGGAFTAADGISSRLIVEYNGSTFLPLGSGLGGGTNINALAYNNGILYVGGNFSSAGGIDLADRMALWNRYTWAHMDIDLPGTPTINDILVSNIEVDPVVVKNRSLYIGGSADGTGNFAGSATPTNDGTTPAFPKIVFSRSGGTGATIQSLRNERTGRGLLFDYDLLDGESLTVDLNPKNRTIVSSFFGPRMDARLKNDDFSVWQLLPGENQVTSFVSESGSPTVTAYLLFRDAYRSYN